MANFFTQTMCRPEEESRSMMFPARREGRWKLSGLSITSVRSTPGSPKWELTMPLSSMWSRRIFRVLIAKERVGATRTAGSK